MTPFTAYPWLLGSYACVVALLLMWGCGSLRSLHLSERIPELVQCSLSLAFQISLILPVCWV
jgi:hypothetical protein